MRHQQVQQLVAEYENKITGLRFEMSQEIGKLQAAETARVAAAAVPAKHGFDHKSTVDRKGFGSLPKYSGSPTEYEDWKFQMKTFLCKQPGMDRMLIALENMLEAPTKKSLEEILDKPLLLGLVVSQDGRFRQPESGDEPLWNVAAPHLLS